MYYAYQSGGEILTADVGNLITTKFPEWRNGFQGSVFPTENQSRMSFEVSYTDVGGIKHGGFIGFTEASLEFSISPPTP